jgi:ubiquinone/menaquinone biosynthesis C-methylase UbiE
MKEDKSMLPSLSQDLIMVPMHALEGLSIRYGFSRTLYRTIAPVYGRSRASHYFGEDLFLDAINPGDSVLELGSGTGFLTRRVGKKAGKCLGLELEQAMVERAKERGGPARYVVGRMEDIPFESKSFDKCICLGAFHCVDPDTVAAAVFLVLKDEGEFLVLIDAKIIPLFAPASGPARVRHALKEQGFDLLDERRVGRLYAWFRGRKKSTA